MGSSRSQVGSQLSRIGAGVTKTLGELRTSSREGFPETAHEIGPEAGEGSSFGSTPPPPFRLPLCHDPEQAGDGDSPSGSESLVDVHTAQSGEKVYSLKQGPPRRGKWSRLEEEYAKR